jgi:F-type H+-transporting ATPase subunit gamma
LTEVLANLYSPELTERFPLLRQLPGQPSRVALVLITSNRGLCGAFNGNLIRKARERIATLQDAGAEVELNCIGRKGIRYFKYVGRKMASARDDIGDRPTAAHATEVMEPLMARFASGELDAVEVIFAKFNSPLSTPPEILPILPVAPQTSQRRGGSTANFILRPSAEEIVGAILPLYVHNAMYRSLVETAASEQGARRTAMKNATDNAGEMIDHLRRVYNRARQGQITQEIAEIVGGAEALKG